MPSIIKNKNAVTKKFHGSSGTEVFGGAFNDDYITDLNGEQAIETYERMRRGDGQIKKVLSAIKSPIRSAKFTHEAKKQGDKEVTKKDEEIADFLNWNWSENPFIDFDKFLNEALTFLEFGYSIHEYVFTYYDHHEFGPVHVLGGLGFRKQKSIFRWMFDGQNGLTHVEQLAYGDTAEDKHHVLLPVENLLINVCDQEGDNYEGISLLRAAYGPWRRKNTFLKLMAVGIEKAAIGTPIGVFPEAMENEGDKTEFIEALKNLATNEQNFIAMPHGYELNILKIDFDAEKINAAITYEDQQISGSCMLSFLELGMNGNGGSYALGEDLSDIALAAQKYVARTILKKMEHVNRQLVYMNFGDANLCPKTRMVGIDKKAGKEFAEVVKMFIDTGVIRPDDTLEHHVREKLDLPEYETTREQDAANNPQVIPPDGPGGTPPPPKKPGSSTPPAKGDKDGKGKTEDPAEAKGKDEKKFSEGGFSSYRELTEWERPLQLAEIAVEFESAASRLHTLMKKNLLGLTAFAVKDFKNRISNRSAVDSRADVALKTKLNVDGYERKLREAMASIVNLGVRQAQRDLKSKDTELKFADETKKAFEFLPKHVQDALKVQAAQQARSQANEVERIIAFGAVASDDAGRTDAQMIKELEEQLTEHVDSPKLAAGARTIASQNINRGRDGFFFRKENLETIQAFQYSAILDSRTTDICLSLDGQVFKYTDSSALRFRPPNHHGCRSILVPITMKERTPEEIVKLKPRTDNPALVNEYEKRKKSVPGADKIEKSRNL